MPTNLYRTFNAAVLVTRIVALDSTFGGTNFVACTVVPGAPAVRVVAKLQACTAQVEREWRWAVRVGQTHRSGANYCRSCRSSSQWLDCFPCRRGRGGLALPLLLCHQRRRKSLQQQAATTPTKQTRGLNVSCIEDTTTGA